MTAKEVAVLNRILARHLSSLLQYLPHAQPWVPAEHQAIHQRLQQLLEEENQACQTLAAAVTRARGIPATARFHPGFTSAHFLALERYLPWLVAYFRWLAAEDEQDLAQLQDPEARDAAETMLATCRRHLEELHQLQAQVSRGPALATLR